MKFISLIILLFILFSFQSAFADQSKPTLLEVVNREIVVNGKKSNVYAIVQPDGTYGLVRKKGQNFNVIVENHLDVPTSIHWHGLILPNDEDGVAYITQSPIRPGERYPYNFPIVQAGTYWMHAHYGLEEQKLLTAPLVILDAITFPKARDVVILFEDFSFQEPSEIYAELRKNYDSEQPPSKMEQRKDIYDVSYDAFLGNRRALSDPDIIRVNPGALIRLRLINGASSTNFFVRLGLLIGQVIAFDGESISPVHGNQFELGMANRLDILVRIPQGEGAYPIFAQGEGTDMQTAVILATAQADIPTLKEKTAVAVGAFSGAELKSFSALSSLESKHIDRILKVKLGGDMFRYIWTINDQVWPDVTPLIVKKGERVEMAIENTTAMSHPMHLHGHVFQITEINGTQIQGVKCDTVLVLPYAKVKIQFDANNPGIWPFHCHNLYHAAAGMFTTLNYIGYPVPNYTKYEQRLVNASTWLPP